MKNRVILVAVLASAWLALVAARLVDLQILHHDEYLDKASDQQQRTMELDPPRGTVYDAQGRELAVSVPVDSLFALPQKISDPAGVAVKLAPILQMDRATLDRRLRSKNQWVYIKRKLDPPMAQKVRELEIEGLGFVEENKRYYPMRELAAQVLGFVGTDNKGLSGLELVYDERIAGEGAKRPVLLDNRPGQKGKLVTPDFAWVEARPGEDLHLTLDATIQHVVEEELAAAVVQHRAKSGTAVILDPNTGAVLAMASYPGYDANEALQHEDLWRVRPVADSYEPGSTFKVITAAAALEHNLVDATDMFDCQMGSITLHGVPIRDHKPFGTLSFRDVMAKSSNVGAIKVGLSVGRDRLFQTIRAFGFGEKTGIDLHGESRGALRDARGWQAITTAYVSFGQGVGVTPLQLAAAIAAVGNGGTLYQPYLVRSVGRPGAPLETRTPREVGKPISAATARQLERILEAILEEGGTAYTAAIPGYRLAGKTGTAQKVIDGRYSRSHFIPNFAGFAPARGPVIAGVITIDEPGTGVTSGGLVAAPVFTAIARRVLPYLGVAPDLTAEDPWAEETGRRPLLVGLAPVPKKKPHPVEDPGPEHADLDGPAEG